MHYFSLAGLKWHGGRQLGTDEPLQTPPPNATLGVGDIQVN